MRGSQFVWPIRPISSKKLLGADVTAQRILDVTLGTTPGLKSRVQPHQLPSMDFGGRLSSGVEPA